MQGSVVSLAEAMTVIFKRRRRYRWVAEAGMMLEIGRAIVCYIAPRSVEAIVIALLSNSAEVRRGRGSLNINHRTMRTARHQQGQRQQQDCKDEKFLHG